MPTKLKQMEKGGTRKKRKGKKNKQNGEKISIEETALIPI